MRTEESRIIYAGGLHAQQIDSSPERHFRMLTKDSLMRWELPDSLVKLQKMDDSGLQRALLQGVSRTFALTIPCLPAPLYEVVANAYLLCRIIDTIEDEVALDSAQKYEFCHAFVQQALHSPAEAADFAERLASLLSSQTIPAEHCLIVNIPRVVAILHGFERRQREALIACVTTMAQGMPRFQLQNLRYGLDTLEDMDRYCYYVAGCVGEMLAKLFCDYAEDIAEHREQLLSLSVSFGQGLQMTNILKDIWDDYERGVCWLPQEVFTRFGFNLVELSPASSDEHFDRGLEYLINIAHGHLHNALSYILLIPKRHTGIRDFCLLALGMALLSLAKIKRNLDFKRSDQVKISRTSVKAVIAVTKITHRHDSALKFLFKGLEKSILTPSRH